MALGENLIKAGFLNEAQLNKALDAQKSAPGKKIGEILIEMGFITPEQLAKVL